MGTTSIVQTELQPSPFKIFPSSHASVHSFFPSPQTGVFFCITSIVQTELQPSPFKIFPSSHVSVHSLFPSPQTGVSTIKGSIVTIPEGSPLTTPSLSTGKTCT